MTHRGVAILVLVTMVLGACASSVDEPAAELDTATTVSTTTGSSSVVNDQAEATTTTSAVASESTTTQASPTTTDATVQACADVIGGTIVATGDGTYRIDATVSSGDTGWDKYADAWEVRSTTDTVLGVRELAHPHETEQPFTRSLSGVEIPPELAEIVLHARDSINGFCGATVTLDVPA